MALNHIHIVGRGAIGSLLAAKASQSNLSFSCETRQRRHSMQWVEDLNNVRISLPDTWETTCEIPENSLVIIPVKAYQIESAITGIKNRLPKSCAILLLHNGMIDKEKVIALFPYQSLFVATTTHAAKREQNQVRITGLGETQFGLAHSSLNRDVIEAQQSEIFILLNKLIAPVSYEHDIEKVLWRKLIVNASINPLTAVHNVKNGELSHSRYTAQIRQIIKEAINVANAVNVNLEEQFMYEVVLQVIKDTAKNYSSMHQDIKWQRPTEVAFINGYIVRLGKQLGINISVNESLLQCIKKLETG